MSDQTKATTRGERHEDIALRAATSRPQGSRGHRAAPHGLCVSHVGVYLPSSRELGVTPVSAFRVQDIGVHTTVSLAPMARPRDPNSKGFGGLGPAGVLHPAPCSPVCDGITSQI